MHRERGRAGEAKRMGGRGGQYKGGEDDRREMRWEWRKQLIHCIQLRLQYSQDQLTFTEELRHTYKDTLTQSCQHVIYPIFSH